MKQHERTNRNRHREQETQSHTTDKSRERRTDVVKDRGETAPDTMPEMTAELHIDLLSLAQSDEQRAGLVMRLQQSHGNAYVQRLLKATGVQAKLSVNAPGDVYEREADRVAESVTSRLTPAVQREGIPEEEIQMKSSSGLQRRETPEEEEPVQMAAHEGESVQLATTIEKRIDAARGRGQALPDSVRSSLEPALGHDFGNVRVHTDAESDRLSQQLAADAFTTGHDIFFRGAAYQPDTLAGKSLLAHELTHVVQQAAVPAVQRHDPNAAGGTGEPPGSTGMESARFAALKGVWEGMVVGQLRKATETLGKPNTYQNIQTAIGQMTIARDTVSAIHSGYGDIPLAERSLASFNNLLVSLRTSLEAHVGVKLPVSDVRLYIDPDGQYMPKGLTNVTKVL